MYLTKDYFDNYAPPDIFICGADKKKIAQIPAIDMNGTFKFNAIDEISFSIYRNRYDAINGQQYIEPSYKYIEAFFFVYVSGFGYYQLQDCNIVSNGLDEHKECTAYSLEYNLTQKYLENFYVNTGTVESVESNDIEYELATEYNPDMLYYRLENGVYILTTVNDEYEFQDGVFYINITRIKLYYPDNPSISLLHLILEKAPDWSIHSVSRGLMYQERTFQVDRQSIYDFIINDLCPTFKCIAIFDTINNEISLIPEDESGETKDYDTDILISFDNLAQQMEIEYSADDIKTVLKVTGDNDLDIRSVNLGSASITDLSWFHTRERMGNELYEKYSNYLLMCKDKEEDYNDLWLEYEGLYDTQNLLLNKVPSTYQVIKIDDVFSKLYCIYHPILSDDATREEIQAAYNAAETALKDKLKLYHIGTETNTKNESILLSLRDSASTKTATIRVTYTESSDQYMIQVSITDPETASVNTISYNVLFWITEVLTTQQDSPLRTLNGYTVSYIGTLGAFFCLYKDETKEETLDEYGLQLLLAQQKKYQAVQSVQVGAGLANAKYNISDAKFSEIMSVTQPEDPSVGDLWLDRNANPSMIKVYKNGSWVIPSSRSDISYMPDDFENYIRYLDNYCKLQCINEAIAKRQQDIKQNDIEIQINEQRRIAITQQCEMTSYFTNDEYKVLSYFLREDEYSDSAFVVTNYMSASEIQTIRQELLKAGETELKRLCEPQLKFTSKLANLLAIPEFESLCNQFQLGNFIHVELRPDYMKTVRLLEVNINFNDFEDFDCTFGNMLESKSQADIHADLLAQATTMAKSVANNSSRWQMAALQADEINSKLNDGLIDTNTILKSSSVDQVISWDESGMRLRKYTDENKQEYAGSQGWITNTGVHYSNDGFRTTDAVFGAFTFNGQTYYGVNGGAIVGSSINIGNGKFVVDAEGNVTMTNADIESYVSSADFSEIVGKKMYRIEVPVSGPTIFTNTSQSSVLSCRIYSWDEDITSQISASNFTWYQNNGTSASDTVYQSGVKAITIQNTDIVNNSRFYCVVNVDTNVTLSSSHVTFIDVTDIKSFQVFLETDVPLVQIRDVKQNTYKPSWNYTNPMIVPVIYINSSPINLSSNSISVSWTRQDGLGTPTSTSETRGEYVINKQLKLVGDNVLSGSSGVVTYICTVTYGNQTATAQITFCRIDSSASPILLNSDSIDNTTQTAQLQQNIMDFTYLDIYYHDSFGMRNSIKIRNASSSSATVKLKNDVLEGGTVSAILTISNKTASMPNTTNIITDEDGNITQSTSQNGYIFIDAIYGI